MIVSRLLIRAVNGPRQTSSLSSLQKGDVVTVVDASESPHYGKRELINNIGINITDGLHEDHRCMFKLDADIGASRYRISEKDVNAILALGGVVETTEEKVREMLIDKKAR